MAGRTACASPFPVPRNESNRLMGLSGDRPLGGDGWFRNHHGIGALLISFEKRPGGGNSNIPLDWFFHPENFEFHDPHFDYHIFSNGLVQPQSRFHLKPWWIKIVQNMCKWRYNLVVVGILFAEMTKMEVESFAVFPYTGNPMIFHLGIWNLQYQILVMMWCQCSIQSQHLLQISWW